MRLTDRSVIYLLVIACVATAAERRVIFPTGAKPVGPYSPGILAEDYLYVSGQGARDAGGKIPDSFERQARQCLDNVRSIVETAGLTMEHLVYSQVYLADIKNYKTLDVIWADYFPESPPARAVLGVVCMPSDTPVEINAVAVRDLVQKKFLPNGAVLTHDRLYIPGVFGFDPLTDTIPKDPALETQLALDEMKRRLDAAGLDFRHVIFVNPYLSGGLPTEVMNRVYAKHFEFGNTPARATIQVAALPHGANIEFTAIAVRDLARRRAVRPKNMPPSPTANPCVFAGETLFCSAKAGFIPGPNGGIFAEDVEHQVRQTMRNLLDGLEEAGLDFSHVVATNVYLDNIDDFAKMNRLYGLYFTGAPPTRTTVQPRAPVKRQRDAEGRMPKLEEISLIAVK